MLLSRVVLPHTAGARSPRRCCCGWPIEQWLARRAQGRCYRLGPPGAMSKAAGPAYGQPLHPADGRKWAPFAAHPEACWTCSSPALLAGCETPLPSPLRGPRGEPHCPCQPQRAPVVDCSTGIVITCHHHSEWCAQAGVGRGGAGGPHGWTAQPSSCRRSADRAAGARDAGPGSEQRAGPARTPSP